eukprot:1160641-Pelagomonas_calceolata.AAC.8
MHGRLRPQSWSTAYQCKLWTMDGSKQHAKSRHMPEQQCLLARWRELSLEADMQSGTGLQEGRELQGNDVEVIGHGQLQPEEEKEFETQPTSHAFMKLCWGGEDGKPGQQQLEFILTS